MKKTIILISIISLLLSNISFAVEKRELSEISIGEFTSEAQATSFGAGGSHLAIAWWMPIEYWKSVFYRDSTTSESDKKALFKALSNISPLGIVQAPFFERVSLYSKDSGWSVANKYFNLCSHLFHSN